VADGPLLGTFIRQTLHCLSAGRNAGLTDSELLTRFAQTRDEVAFETLLWRHGRLRLWDTTTGKEVLQIETGPIKALCFSPDNRVLAAALGKEVRLWELLTGKERYRCRGHERLVQSVAFSPDGTILASGSEDTTILLWDLTGRGVKGRPDALAPGEETPCGRTWRRKRRRPSGRCAGS